MKNILIILFMILPAASYAQQPPKSQANRECRQVESLATSIATLKNNGATLSDVIQAKNMARDGNGIMGDMALVLFDMHTKGANPNIFGKKMFERCMKSNGY
jgi:hypothetical protein